MCKVIGKQSAIFLPLDPQGCDSDDQREDRSFLTGKMPERNGGVNRESDKTASKRTSRLPSCFGAARARKRFACKETKDQTKDGRVAQSMSLRAQGSSKGGGDRRLYSESMPDLDSSKMIIDAGSSDNIASTRRMWVQLGWGSESRMYGVRSSLCITYPTRKTMLAKKKGVGIAFMDVEEESIECYTLIVKPTSRAEDRWDAIALRDKG
ncbi:hypothetical protein Tco_0526412 [Tanacetum coccineum]